MLPDRPSSRTVPRGITVRGVLAILIPVALLLIVFVPTISTGHPRGKLSDAKSLLSKLKNAMEIYREDQGAYPPDWIPMNTRLLKFAVHDLNAGQAKNSFTLDSPIQCGAEALYYYLANSFITEQHPLLSLSDDEITDRNGNGIREICGPWGRPILYDRPPFPKNKGYDCPDSSGPKHNPDSYDLYILRPTGMFDSIEVVEPGEDTLRRFNTEAMKAYGIGDHPDVIGNW